MENQVPFTAFNLSGDPFDQAATADRPYLSASFQETLARLYYGLEYGSRILIISAERGTGTTTLLRYLERRLRDRSPTLLLSLTGENGREVLCKLLSEIGGSATSDDLLVAREQLDARVAELATADKPFTLLLDHEDDSPIAALEVLRQFATLESIERGLLRVVMASCPEATEHLRSSDLADEILSLSRLTDDEVGSYIEHRLRLVGWSGARLFTSGACTLIAQTSSGRPSTINEICSNLLQNFYQRNGVRASRIEEGALDEASIESVISGRNLAGNVPGNDHPAKPYQFFATHRTPLLASIMLLLVIALAGLWFRSVIKARSTKHLSAAIGARSSAHWEAAGVRAKPQERISNTTPGWVSKNGSVGKINVAGAAVQAASPVRNGHTAPPARIEAPAASTTAAATTLNTRAVDVAGSHVLGSAPQALSVSAQKTVLDHSRPDPDGGSAIHDQMAGSTGPRTMIPPGPTSSSKREQNTSVPATAAGIPAPEGKNRASRAKELAAYQIRLGDAYMSLGDYDKARSSFASALGLAPNNKEALDKMKRAERAKGAEQSVLQ